MLSNFFKKERKRSFNNRNETISEDNLPRNIIYLYNFNVLEILKLETQERYKRQTQLS